MTAALDVVLAIASLPLLAACVYLALLALASRRRPAPPSGDGSIFFHLVVPAHDEEAGIASTVQSVVAVDYPRARFRVLVVADNCSDQTAERARGAGASVLVRDDLLHRGKGYALEYAFDALLAHGPEGAVVVIDADTVVSPNLLAALAARLEGGAAAAQVDYAVRNPQASWRTRLMTLALAMFHVLRSLGRENLGLSCGLRGNGMCFSTSLLRMIPHRAFSLVEDVEYGVRLGEAGHRVQYVPEAHVYGEMVSAERASRSQRHRWEGGRLALARERGPTLLRNAFMRRDPVLLDLAMDVLVPPLATLAILVVAGFCASALLYGRTPGLPLALLSFGGCAACLAGYVARGWVLSGTGVRGLLDLACAPGYVLWKLAVSVSRTKKQRDWVRTTREGPSV